MLSGRDDFTKCSIRESRACATRYIVYRQACISKRRSSVETATQNMRLQPEGRYIAMWNNTHFIWMKASLQCHCMSSPITVQKCIGTLLYLIISLVTQTSGIDICQIGYDICESDSLRGLGIDIIGRVHLDNRNRFAIWMGSIGKATEPCQQTSGCWHLTFDSFLNLDMGDDTNTKFLLLRVQTTYMT